jgi:DUF1009 family protein
MHAKLGIIAGNRLLPLLLAQRIRENNKDCQTVAICFKGETNLKIARYTDSQHWIKVGELGKLKAILAQQGITQCFMAGQINPLRVFRRKDWDQDLVSLVEKTRDFRPHTIFKAIISSLEEQGLEFVDSTSYLKDDLAKRGSMNNLSLSTKLKQDIDFGLKLISGFVELDVGQTIVVKQGLAGALESLEGTDRTIKRGFRICGRGCTVLKFSKVNQDLRFDVPVVGLATLRLLRQIKASGLVLESERVIILEKAKFLSLAEKWGIPVVGRSRQSF